MEFSSQYGEDRWIESHWRELGLPDRGVFAEFGAGDGHEFSNTRWLEMSHGWRGLLCEPDPRHDIGGRGLSVVYHCAVGPTKTIELAMCAEPMLSGELRTQTENRRLHVVGWHRVQQRPLSELLVQAGFDRLDIVSIDTEGTELQGWRSIDLERHRPRVAVIELATWGLDANAAEIVGELQRCGYRIAKRTECNGIFVDEAS